MGGSSSSSSSSKHYNTNTSIAVDGDANAPIVTGSRNTITQTDHGAIDKALLLSDETVGRMQDLSESAIGQMGDLAGSVVDKNHSLVIESLGTAETATEDALEVAYNVSQQTAAGVENNNTKYLAFTAIAVAVAMAYRGRA